MVPTQSQLARCTSPSNVFSEKPLKGAGRPVAPLGPATTLVARAVEDVRDTVLVVERVIDLDAVLVRRFDRALVLGDVIIVHVPERSRNKSGTIRHQHTSGKRDVLLGDVAETLDRNLVVRKRIADEGAGWARLRVVAGS